MPTEFIGGVPETLALAGIRRAVVLVGSQKTLPIAVTVLNQMTAFMDGPLGLAIIPCVVAHLSQILVDSLLVSKWLRADSEVLFLWLADLAFYWNC